MLSAGERPQPAHASTVKSTVPASKARTMPDLAANGANGAQSSLPKDHMQHIWVVTGPAGCGKSTVGNVLRTELGIPFIEGDDVSARNTQAALFPSSSIAPNPAIQHPSNPNHNMQI